MNVGATLRSRGTQMERKLAEQKTRRRRRALMGSLWLLLLPALALGSGGASAALSGRVGQAGTPNSWAEAASQNEVAILNQQSTFSVRYRERKKDAKGDTTRDMVEAKEGGVARLVERDGKPITAAEDTAERARLQDAMSHPAEFIRHHRRDVSTRNDAIALLRLMPKSMLYTYAEGQPQPPDAKATQVVLDFTPDPNFSPPTMLSEVLTGLAGRVWIDEATKHVTRVEAHVIRPVNFGFGIVAKLYPGGTIVFEQADAGDGHWMYTHIDEHLVVRALMLKTMTENVEMRSAHVEPLPKLVGYQEAIKLLLSTSIPLR